MSMATRKPERRSPDRTRKPSREHRQRRGGETSSWRRLPRTWLTHHLQALVGSLGRLVRAPLGNLMTVLVLGIALALPASLHLALANARQLSNTWEGAARISLYLRLSVPDSEARGLARRIEGRPEVASVRYITRDEALAEFRQASGLDLAIDSLGENPLPATLVVSPVEDMAQPGALERLREDLQALPGVELARLDLEWVQRLYALMELVWRAVMVIGALLGLAVILVIGNTIRLAIENRREEIVVMKLVGATDGFVRRPFLYTGLWYGLAGGSVAWLLVALSLGWLHAPVRRLALLYQSGFTLRGLAANEVLALLAFAVLLGLSGAWLAVGRHLKSIEPT